MSDWTNSHDLVYAFVCVSFLADGDVDESEVRRPQHRVADRVHQHVGIGVTIEPPIMRDLPAAKP